MLIGSDGRSLEAVAGGHVGLEWFIQAFEHAPVAMALVGTDDRILHANPAMARITGYELTDLSGLTLDGLTHPDDRKSAAAARAAVLRGQRASTSTDARLLRADGRPVWASMWCSGAGDVVSRDPLVVQLVDVTERKRAERELSRSNAELRSFAYLAAHELKAPLQSLTGFTTLLERIHGHQLDAQGREFVRWILDGANRMDCLIEALLAYCVVDRNEAVLAPVALQNVVDEALAQLGAELTSRGAVVTAGPLPVVSGDPVQLGQLLQNLLANALKFVPDGRAPQVHVSAERTGDGWTVTVADNGIGVGAADRERIFTMFERLHPRERYQGTGIGLSICKRIVERRGGTIWVEPNAEAGSRFRFHLPDA